MPRHIGAHGARGLTLIELVVAITIVAIAATAVLGALSTITSRGANTMVRQQAVAIAEAYLEEILLQPVAAPVGVPTPTLRANFNDVDEYNGLLDVGACDQFGNPLPGLSGYTVGVAVVQTSALSGIAPANARRIDVSVTDPTGVLVTLSGYRANF
jgi:MSHA pilin protein MshD